MATVVQTQSTQYLLEAMSHERCSCVPHLIFLHFIDILLYAFYCEKFPFGRTREVAQW